MEIAQVVVGGLVFFALVIGVPSLVMNWRSNRRPCPHCGSSIPLGVSVCRHCGRDL